MVSVQMVLPQLLGLLLALTLLGYLESLALPIEVDPEIRTAC